MADPDRPDDTTVDVVPGRSTATGHGPPLTARSVVASVLLGTDPPVMHPQHLVRAGELFGIAEGTIRTAVSRMASAGEIARRPDGRYEIVGHLADRRLRQLASRQPGITRWNGNWEMWLVAPTPRPPDLRAALRRAAVSLRLAEARDGVWMRPDNLRRAGDGDSPARQVMAAQASRLTVQPDHDDELAASLWDLHGWNDRARALRREMHALTSRLAADDTGALVPGFVLSAAVLRHLNSDPLLPVELRHTADRSDDQGAALRRDYDAYDVAYRALLGRWLRGPVDTGVGHSALPG